MKKKLLSMVLALVMVAGLSGGALAADVTPKVNIDGVEFVYDTATYGVTTAVDGRIYVPLRVIAEKLGYEVGFVDGKATVNGPRGLVIIDLGNLDSKSFSVGAVTEILDTPVAMVVNNRTLVALRGFGNALGCGVEWREGAAWINKNAPSEAESVENKIVSGSEGVTSEGNTSVDTVIKDFDANNLPLTQAAIDNIVASAGSSVSPITGNTLENAVSYISKEGAIGLAIGGYKGEENFALRLWIESTGTVVINESHLDGNRSTKAWRTTVDTFLSEVANPSIKAPTMAMIDKLIAKSSEMTKNGTVYSKDLVNWMRTNVYYKGFKLTDEYYAYFDATGMMELRPNHVISDDMSIDVKFPL